ncbi:MAG: hypothetical protein KJ889_02560 [Gammaproteobacteria bacterium]|nr:hypothetical protein [Gammaproteobacteria bacterium]
MVPAELERQAEIAHWINANLSVPFSLSGKDHLALSCFDLSVEHHAAICALCDIPLYGSMFALVRVQFEALGNGLWLRHAASQEQAEKYQTKDGLKGIGFGTLLTIFEARVGASAPAFTDLKKRYWEILSNFTHTGFQGVARRSDDTHTGGVNYSEQEVLTMLRLSGVLAHVAAIELAGLSGGAALISTSLDRFRQYGA